MAFDWLRSIWKAVFRRAPTPVSGRSASQLEEARQRAVMLRQYRANKQDIKEARIAARRHRSLLQGHKLPEELFEQLVNAQKNAVTGENAATRLESSRKVEELLNRVERESKETVRTDLASFVYHSNKVTQGNKWLGEFRKSRLEKINERRAKRGKPQL